jgi:hypothetical protein
MVQQVRRLGGLMIVQGILSCSVGFISLAVIGPLNIFLFSRQHSQSSLFWKEISWVYIVSGFVILMSGIFNVLAGVRIRKFQNRALAIGALITNVVYMFSFFSLPCSPIALALMIFGLVVLLNQDVRRAFADHAATSITPDPLLEAVPTLPVEKPDWFTRNWKWLVPGILFLPVLVLGGFGGCLFFGIQYGFKSSDVYKNAVSRVKTDPTVTRALGSPIEPGLFPYSGNISGAGPVGHAEMDFPISGPKGAATVHLVADRKAGEWEFEVLEVTVEGTDQPINLLLK